MPQSTPRRQPYIDSKGQRVTGIYTRQTKAGETVFEIGWTEAGKQRWRTVSGGITAAKTARATELARVASGGRATSNPRLTFDDAAGRWWEAHKPSCAPKTVASYELSLTHLRPVFGRKRMTKITADDVARYVRDKQATHKGWTVATHLTVLGSVFKYASRRMDYVGQNPVSLLERGERPNKGDARQQRSLTSDELARLLSLVPDAHRLMFRFAAETGARISEVLGLVWDDVHFEEETVSFNMQIDKGGRRVPVKTARSRRTIEIRSELIGSLREHKLASPFTGRHDFVFATRNGTAYNANNIGSRLFPIVAEQAGLSEVRNSRGEIVEHKPTFHALRHTHGSMLLALGWDLEAVSARLGHANTITTQKTYIHEYDRIKRSKQRRDSLNQLFAADHDASATATVTAIR